MTKVLHIADTHLGYRLRTDFRKDWFKFGEIRWYENDFYERWMKFINFCIKNKDNIDFVVHSGDFFHLPFGGSPYPPPEPAREYAVKGLNLFFNQTDSKIPFILIDGNHGVYQGYRYSLLDSITPNFSELYYFSIWYLKKAINDNKPLVCEFSEKQIRFYLFPYFEYTHTEDLKIAYNNWIESQKPKDDMISIAVVHGSKIDDTLHVKISEFNYDYVALGHEHNQNNLTNKIWYAGSFVPLHFNEVDFEHGFLEVDLEKGKSPIVKEHTFKSLRDFKQFKIKIGPTSTTQSIINSIKDIIEPFKVSKWDGKTASRLKIDFIGNIELKSFWGLNDELNNFKIKVLNEGNYNLLQLILNWKTLDKELGDNLTPEIIEDYILKNPKGEYLDYLKGKIKGSEGYDMELLADIALSTLENSLKKMEEE